MAASARHLPLWGGGNLTHDELIARARQAIDSGAAVCLLGAGFARMGTDAKGASIPTTEELTEELKDVFDIPPKEKVSLAEVAEFAAEQDGGRAKLNSYLVKRLTSTRPSRSQSKFLEQPWRALFTTNFDDVLEQVSAERRVSVTPTTTASTIPPDKTPIYYMHGRALDLRERDIDPSLVISERNYLKLEQKNRDLYAKFFNEVVCSRAIVIVGYSLKDLEIASGLLNAGADVRDKTYIITSDVDTPFTTARLKKFGHVLEVGLDGFVSGLMAAESSEAAHVELQFLKEVAYQACAEENEAEDFLSLILTGNFDPSRYLRQRLAPNEPYCVERSDVAILKEAGVNRFLISADFGNGKSAFLGQAAARLIESGFRVFFVETRLPEVFEDIESVLKGGAPVAFLVDDVLRYREVAIFIGQRLHGNSILITTTRGDQDSRFEKIASQFGGAFRSIDLNYHNDDELVAWNGLLERWGYWGERSGLGAEKRLEFLKERCGGENRSIVLSIFEDSKVARTIDKVVEFFLRNTNVHGKAFAGLLVSSLCQKHVTWSSVVSWLDLDESALRADIMDSEISFLFQRGRNWNLFTSAQLADYILRHKFVEEDRDLLVDVYSTIVLKTANSANDSRSGWDFRENLKELMRFRFLTRLFGDSDASGVLIGRVYRRLSQAPRIRNNPQFWLQYAMSRMEADDLEGAETYIKTSLSKAEARGADYYQYQILDQRARLFFIKNTRMKDRYSEGEIRIAVSDLSDLNKENDDVIYAMRSMPLVEDFLEAHIDNLTNDMRTRISALVIELEDKGAGFQEFPRAQKGETRVLRDALRNVKLLLFNA